MFLDDSVRPNVVMEEVYLSPSVPLLSDGISEFLEHTGVLGRPVLWEQLVVQHFFGIPEVAKEDFLGVEM
ncbi:hypothetical protein Y032_0040g281 [Ancylostoma ceylanicum]|uniref:Uncharacterized protein n=1 Tax=Ancylostoma ceylanicum TaxID=53326 RepID=A0A016UI78_9BILA|nr:hypothetical protein Y032_0040g281 [Ancylostoma ceylanicum]